MKYIDFESDSINVNNGMSAVGAQVHRKFLSSENEGRYTETQKRYARALIARAQTAYPNSVTYTDLTFRKKFIAVTTAKPTLEDSSSMSAQAFLFYCASQKFRIKQTSQGNQIIEIPVGFYPPASF